MRTIDIRQVDAFSRSPFEGNPAGVVTRAEGLTDREMQLIAKEMNCSETAFVLPSTKAELRLRYFTPAQEVALCGHATIATLQALREEGRAPGPLAAETNVGVLTLEVGEDAHFMRQDTPRFRTWDGDDAVLADLLGLAAGDLDPELAIGIAYTGLWDLLVPVRSLAALQRAQPDPRRLGEHNRGIGVVSTHLYCRETLLAGSALHTRDFSPAAGVPEDPHTGTASGALGAYLVHVGALPAGSHVFEQGWTVGRPGLIQVRVEEAGRSVQVGGTAVTVLEGHLRLPEPA